MKYYIQKYFTIIIIFNSLNVMGVLTTLRLLVKIMLFQFNLIKTKEARKTLLYLYPGIWSSVLFWPLEYGITQELGTQCCTVYLWLSSQDLLRTWMFLSLMISPSTTRWSWTTFWWTGSLKVKNFLFWVPKLREIESTCYDMAVLSYSIC